MRFGLPIKAVFLLLFRPTEFVAFTVLYEVESEFETNTKFSEENPNRQLPPERLKRFEDNAWNRTKKIRAAFFTAVWSTTFAILVGVLAGCYANSRIVKPSGPILSALQVAGSGIILVATLALLGQEIQSWSGNSLPERTNRWLFKVQYWLGTALFVFSLSWTG